MAAAVVGNFPLLLFGMAAFGAVSLAPISRPGSPPPTWPSRNGGPGRSPFVVWATTIGAVLGPNIAAPAGRSVAGPRHTRDGRGPSCGRAAVFLLTASLIARTAAARTRC